MKKVKDLTVGEIRQYCISSTECQKCPLNEYHNARLCNIAFNSTRLTPDDMEVEK